MNFKIHKKRVAGIDDKNAEKEDFSPEQIIYIEIDDEITNVFDRVKQTSGKKLALVVPKRAVLLQSIVNLKILKKKIDELRKEIIVITSDLAGLQLAEKAGIPAIEHLFEKVKDTTEEKKDFPPLQRSQRPQRITEEKISIAEVIRGGKTNTLGSFARRIKEKFKKKKKTGRETRLVFIAPNKQALFTLILVSVLLLLAIAYIALPGATIYITPKSDVLDPSFNVTFMDFAKNRDLLESSRTAGIAIASYPLKPPQFTKKLTHPATGKLFRGENARGIITIINMSSAPWDLAARTRFQTEEGLIFRMPSSVRVPPKKGDAPGTFDVNVIADPFDVNGQVIGERGNISPTKFFLPGFKNPENRKNLWGESRAQMTGGTTKTVKMVTKDDIEAARGNAKREIQKTAAEDLKKYLEQENLLKKTNLSLLTDNNVIKISEPVITVPDVAGEALDQFEITASYAATGIAFDREQLVSALKQRLVSRVDPDKKILKIYEDDIAYRFLDEDVRRGHIRLTATMRAVQIYELDPEKENGARFIKKITDHILGMRVTDALTYLQQQTDEISRVEITTWPVWAPTIPNIADNVKFVIRQEETEPL